MTCPVCWTPNPDNATVCCACNATLAPVAHPTPPAQTVSPTPPAPPAAPTNPPAPPTVPAPPAPPAPPTPPTPPTAPAPPVQTADPSPMVEPAAKNKTPMIIAGVVGVVLLMVIGFFAAKWLTGGSGSKTASDDETSVPVIADTETYEGNDRYGNNDSYATVSTDDYMYPADGYNYDERFWSFDWLSEREITPRDLSDLTSEQLRLLRNAIFAMHGYRFKSADLQEYFGQFEWYTPRYVDVTSMLSPIEKKNITTIQRME